MPVPNLSGDTDWSVECDKLGERALEDIETRGLIPNLRERIVVRSAVDPRYFRDVLNTHEGSGFGLEPVLRQTAWMRPHNKSDNSCGVTKTLCALGATWGGESSLLPAAY